MVDILPDQSSYMDHEGDVLPLVDLEEPTQTDDIDVYQQDLVDTQKTAHATITQPESFGAEDHTDNYRQTVAHVMEGLAQSYAGGWGALKVELNGQRVPAGQYLSNEIYKIPMRPEERQEIIDWYGKLESTLGYGRETPTTKDTLAVQAAQRVVAEPTVQRPSDPRERAAGRDIELRQD